MGQMQIINIKQITPFSRFRKTLKKKETTVNGTQQLKGQCRIHCIQYDVVTVIISGYDYDNKLCFKGAYFRKTSNLYHKKNTGKFNTSII